jgi:putative tricarboxylic transport membrane protein
MRKQRGFSLETAFEGLLALGGAGVMVVSLSYGFGTLRRAGPGLYPFFIGLFIFVFSLALLFSKSKSQAPSVPFTPEGKKTLLFMSVVFCLWILLMPILGYVVVTVLVALAFCRIMKLEGWWKPICVSFGTALFIYLMFDYWLYIDLPRGFLG